MTVLGAALCASKALSTLLHPAPCPEAGFINKILAVCLSVGFSQWGAPGREEKEGGERDWGICSSDSFPEG